MKKVIWNIVKYVILIAIGVLLFIPCRMDAVNFRGGYAYGGELFIIVAPMMIYLMLRDRKMNKKHKK